MFYIVPDSIQVFELGMTYSDAEVIKAFGYLSEINRGVTDRLVLYAASSVANRLVLGSKDFFGIGARDFSDEYFLRQKQCTRIKIPDRRQRPRPAVLSVILNSNHNGFDGIVE